jgi:hypothetical protein
MQHAACQKVFSLIFNHLVIATKSKNLKMKFIIVLSALFAVAYATVSGDYGSVGVQGEQTVRGALNTISSYQKAVNTGTSQSFVSRTDYTNNPGVIAHPFAAVAGNFSFQKTLQFEIILLIFFIAAPVAAYHAPIAAYHAPIGAYHAPIAAAYHAPVYGGATYIH